MEYLTIDDLKNEAGKKVPKAFHDYVLSGSWTESTLKDNSNDFKKISFRQRVAVDISNRSTRKSLLGTDYKMPVALAPVGLLGICLLYTSPSPRDGCRSRMPSSA